MPLKAINYDNTHFYKIVCKDINIKNLYVGHTTDFISRKSNHKHSCNTLMDRLHNKPLYCFIREKGGWDNWDMVLIKTHKCENGLEARKIEREYIEEYEADLNRNKAFESEEEKLMRRKRWRNDNKDSVAESTKQSTQRLKQQFPERYKEYARRNYEKNKDEILKKQQQKVECDCGSVVCKGDISTHKKTKKHQQYVQSISQEEQQEAP